MYKEVVFFRPGRILLGSFIFSILISFLQLSTCAAASVTLAWSASTDSIVAGYNMYYGGASGTYTNEIPVGSATSVTVTGLVQGATYYFAATTYSAAGVESSYSSEVSYTVPAVVSVGNVPPTLNAIGNLSINENAGLQTVNLSGITSGATNQNQTLTVSAVSGNTGLIPNPTVSYTSASTTGSLSFTPVANGSGTATVTVTVNNGGTSNNIVTQTFTVTVNAVNQAPTLNAIGNLSINENAGLQTVNLSGITSGAANENQKLTVSAVSSNTGLIPNPAVSYTSANTTGSLSFTPVANGSGTATVSVTVNDGGTSNNIVTRTFTVVVNAVSTGSTNAAPTLDPIKNVTVTANAGEQTIALTGIGTSSSLVAGALTPSAATAGSARPRLTITATTSNRSVSSDPRIHFDYASATGGLTIKPRNVAGTATISVTVCNGAGRSNAVTRTFTVTVLPNTNLVAGVASSNSSELTKNITTVGSVATASLQSAAYANGHYAFTVSSGTGNTPSVVGQQFVVEASTNLVDWTPIQTNAAPFTFVDANASRFSQRFYRAIPAP